MSSAPIQGLGARKAALRLLDAVLRQGQPLESALASATRDLSNPPDRALSHAIASEALRRLVDLDRLIDSATRQRLPDDSKARMVLRIALVQALALKTPEHAAVSTALPLVDGGPRRLVHGVLGTLLRSKAQLPDPPSLPEAALCRWKENWGDEAIALARQAFAGSTVLDLTLRNAGETEYWAERLEGETLMPGHIRLARQVSVPDLPGFNEGAWWVQNFSAALPARLLGAGEGRTILDLCAAPGGKTMQLAAAGWRVTALETNQRRLSRIKENLSRTGLLADLVEADVLKWSPREPVDAILLDAPCTSTGIFARHPDVLHRVNLRDIEKLAQIQQAMLDCAAQWLKPGGTLVYATCSLERQEGEDIKIPAQLQRVVIPESLCPLNQKPDANGALRILPKHNMDGFFILLCTTS